MTAVNTTGSKLSIRVVPGSSRVGAEPQADHTWKIRLRARAVEGQANSALIEQLAEWLDISRSRVRIVRGQTARLKVVEISGMELDEVTRRLGALA